MSYTINYAPDNFSYTGRFNLEDTGYELSYIYPWLQSGNLELIARLKDVKPGIWTLRLYPEFIIKGEYDVYLPNKNLISDETRFINPTSESTITFFATTRNVITVGAYNGKTNGIWIGSSNGSLRTSPIKPDIVAPGVDIIAPYGNTYTYSGYLLQENCHYDFQRDCQATGSVGKAFRCLRRRARRRGSVRQSARPTQHPESIPNLQGLGYLW